MTTIPGHNQLLQQSVMAQELGNQANKPSPDQAAALQQAQDVVRNTTIQGSEESERLKRQKERDRKFQAKKAEKKKDQEKEQEIDPDVKGRLLDTRV